tara:strand:+ start:22966 stop:23754 length:789 start_codon:yes stop_codon:yes gene_type:complete
LRPFDGDVITDCILILAETRAMTQTFVDTIPMLPFGMLNAFLISRGDRAVLVDTGLPNSEPKIEKALNARRLDWSNLTLILLTHAHIDHAGSAARVQMRSAAPLLAHHDELPYCQGEPPRLRPSGPFGRVFYRTGAIQRPFEAVTPDVIMTTDGFDLSEFGIAAQVLHTPGHTPGSVSVLLEDGRVIAGDLAASGILLGGIACRARPKSPPFEEEPLHVVASLQRLLSVGGRAFFLGHGGPLSAKAVQRHCDALRHRFTPRV